MAETITAEIHHLIFLIKEKQWLKLTNYLQIKLIKQEYGYKEICLSALLRSKGVLPLSFSPENLPKGNSEKRDFLQLTDNMTENRSKIAKQLHLTVSENYTEMESHELILESLLLYSVNHFDFLLMSLLVSYFKFCKRNNQLTKAVLEIMTRLLQEAEESGLNSDYLLFIVQLLKA